MPRSSVKLRVSTTKIPTAIRADATYVGVTQITPMLLARPVAVTLNPGRPLLLQALPLEMSRLELTLEGRVYQFEFADEVVEKAKGFRHVTMSVLNEEDASARFSIDQSGGDIYGTLRTSSGIYVFEPGEGSGEQLVHRYDAHAPEGKRFAVREKGDSMAEPALARRHRQVELIAALQPQHAWTGRGTVFLQGGDLGAVQNVSPNAFRRAAMRLSLLTEFTGDETFVRTELRETSDGQQLATFAQTIGGIPVDSVNEMLIDKAGKILQISTTVMPANLAPLRPLIVERSAVAGTHAQWQSQFGKRASQIEVKSPVRLRYRLAQSGMRWGCTTSSSSRSATRSMSTSHASMPCRVERRFS
jgi:hypothetical protein